MRMRQAEVVRDAKLNARTATRLAWSLWVACVALMSLALLLAFLTDDVSYFWELRSPVLAVLAAVLSLICPTIGALIASRLPRNAIGWIFCGVGLLYQLERFTSAYADYALLQNVALPWGEYAAWFSTGIGFPGPILAGVFLMLLFPDGRLLSRRWEIVAWAAVLGAALTALADAFYPGPLSTFYVGPLATRGYVENPFGVVGVIGGRLTTYDLFAASYILAAALLLVSSLAALFSLILRLLRTRGDERQQLKWFSYGAAPAAVALSVSSLQAMITNYTTNFLSNTMFVMSDQTFHASSYVYVFALLVLPVFTYIAILRHRLYDIDLIINRTLVYGALTACVVSIYVLAVGGLGALFQARGNLAISLLATGLVAVVFQPLRSRLQRGVNRLMYGERDDPYAVLSRLGRRLEATLAPETVLPTIVETIAQALKLPYAAILLKEGESFRSAAAYGSPTGEPEALPLIYQREEIGRLVLSHRAPGEEFSAADRRLLEDLARQAEVAVHAVRLTADLQHARERLVATREEERRRLRRDLHDGIGPTLTGLALQLNAAHKLVMGDEPKDAGEVLARLEQEAEDTIAEMRRLIYGLRPPALDDLGLIPSIRQQAQSQGMADLPIGTKSNERSGNRPVFSMEAPEELPPLPAAVEVACYRIAQEALTNVARHARAKTCQVRLSVDEVAGALGLEVIDDGVGMLEDRVAGVGLSSMRERAEELGGTLAIEAKPEGGTSVLARLPLSASEEYPEGAMSWSTPSASS